MRNLDLTIRAEGDFKCWWKGWWSYGWVYSLTRAFQFVWRMVCLGLGGGGDWNRASGEALEISQFRAGMLVTWPSGGCGEGEE